MLRVSSRFFIAFFALFSFIGTAFSQDLADTVARQGIVIDYDTGMVLFDKDAEERMPTSSMSKVVTMYATFEALRDGRLSLDQKLPVSEKAWKMGGSKMFVEVGDNVAVDDLIQGVIVQSGNDATVVLAEGIAGSEAAFVRTLNGIAEKLGMKDSHFMNASGWPDPEHYSTAHDLAILAMHIITDFPEDYHYFAEREFTFNNIKQGNRNPLLYRNIGADGLKTGHTEAGGYGLMASGTDGARRVVVVLNGMPDEQARADEGAKFLEWGLKNFENYTLFKAGDVVEQADVALGAADSVPLTVSQDVKVTVPYSVRNDLSVQVVYDGPLIAPVKKGDQVATLNVEVPRVGKFSVPLMAGSDVGKPGFFAAAAMKAKLLLGGGA